MKIKLTKISCYIGLALTLIMLYLCENPPVWFSENSLWSVIIVILIAALIIPYIKMSVNNK